MPYNRFFFFCLLSSICEAKTIRFTMGSTQHEIVITSEQHHTFQTVPMKNSLLNNSRQYKTAIQSQGINPLSTLYSGYKAHFKSNPNTPILIDNEWIIKKSTSPIYLSQIAAQTRPIIADYFLLSFPSIDSGLRFQSELRSQNSNVEFYPNFITPKVYKENHIEPYMHLQWHLKNVGQTGGKKHADSGAWKAHKITRGSKNILVAILDSGFDLKHPDLERRFFINSKEQLDDEIDNDENGYIDDYQGWNFYRNNNDPSKGIANSHGTAVTGVIAASENNEGVLGICPKCTILPIVPAWKPSGDAFAFLYAMKMGARVINNSWGYPVGIPTTTVVEKAIKHVAYQGNQKQGTSIVFAMSNQNKNDCIPPQDISALDSVIAVSSSNDQDHKTSYGSYGPCMEILAPSYDFDHSGITTTDSPGLAGRNGEGTLEDLADLDYTLSFSGNSAAAPMVSGALGLVYSLKPKLTAYQALKLLLSSANKIEEHNASYNKRGKSITHGYGRLNIWKALKKASTY